MVGRSATTAVVNLLCTAMLLQHSIAVKPEGKAHLSHARKRGSAAILVKAGDWTPCNCEVGERTREWESVDASEPGADLSGAIDIQVVKDKYRLRGRNKRTQVEDCACAVDCVGAWGAWGVCDRTCGHGFRERTFQVTTAVAGGGVPCPHNDGVEDEDDPCNLGDCDPECGDVDAQAKQLQLRAEAAEAAMLEAKVVAEQATEEVNKLREQAAQVTQQLSEETLAKEQALEGEKTAEAARAAAEAAADAKVREAEQAQQDAVRAQAEVAAKAEAAAHMAADAAAKVKEYERQRQDEGKAAVPLTEEEQQQQKPAGDAEADATDDVQAVDCIESWGPWGACSCAGVRGRTHVVLVEANEQGVGCESCHGSVETQACDVPADSFDCDAETPVPGCAVDKADAEEGAEDGPAPASSEWLRGVWSSSLGTPLSVSDLGALFLSLPGWLVLSTTAITVHNWVPFISIVS